MIANGSIENKHIRQGKALALAIKGLISISQVTNGYGVVEVRVRNQMLKLYRRELRNILGNVSSQAANEILAIIGPDLGTITIDVSMN